MLWLVAIPLVHVHPEADHAHGAQEHQHGGLFHSVFSQDLACEFHNHIDDRPHTPEIDKEGPTHCHQTQAHLHTHDEIGFSLLGGSPNDSSINQTPFTFLIPHTHSSSLQLSSAALPPSSQQSPPFQRSAPLSPIRPPPISLM